jgi:hypothetical protein
MRVAETLGEKPMQSLQKAVEQREPVQKMLPAKSASFAQL